MVPAYTASNISSVLVDADETMVSIKPSFFILSMILYAANAIS